MKPSLKIKRPVVFSQVSDSVKTQTQSELPGRPVNEREATESTSLGQDGKVMGRLEWFRDLKNVFLKLQEESSESPAVLKNELMRGIKEYRFELQDGETYYQREKTVAFSYEEVYTALESLTDHRISWDQVIDAIFQIGVTRAKLLSKVADDHRVSLTTSQSVTSITQQAKEPAKSRAVPPMNHYVTFSLPSRSPANTLEIAFPDEKLTTLPMAVLNEKRDTLLVSGAKVSLCASLIILNLSFNQLTEFEVVAPMPCLRLLNLSNNAIRRLAMLQKCKGVQEAYLGHNRLTMAGALCHLEKLSLLDLSQNSIGSFEDVASLAINARLIGLRLKGNPIASRSGYVQTIRALLPKVQHLDEPSLRPLSDFEALGSLSFLLPRVPVDAPKSTLHSETASEVSSHRSDSQKRGAAPRSIKPPNLNNRYLHATTPPHRGTQRTGCRPTQSTKSTPMSRRTPNASVTDLRELQVTHRSEDPDPVPRLSTPPKRSETSFHKLPIKRSNPPVPDSPLSSHHNPPPSHHSRGNQSFEQALSFLSEVEKRLDEEKTTVQDVGETRGRPESKDHSVSLVTAEAIQNAHDRRYGNPVATMMIGPPATPQKSRNASMKRKEPNAGMGLNPHRSVPKVRTTAKSPLRDSVVQLDLARRYH